MSDDLRPCPFCGSEDVGLTAGRQGEYHQFFMVECCHCGASGPPSKSFPEDRPDGEERTLTVDRWNERRGPLPAELESEKSRADAACDHIRLMSGHVDRFRAALYEIATFQPDSAIIKLRGPYDQIAAFAKNTAREALAEMER